METPMKILLVTLDIEGCLTINKGVALPLQALDRLQKAKATAPFVLSTGRPQPYAELMIQILGPKASVYPSVVENGCFLYDSQKEIMFPHPLVTKGIIEDFDGIRGILEECFPESPVQPGKELCISLTPHKKIGVEDLFQSVQRALEIYKKKIFISHSNSAVDITPKGIDKGTGLLFLCKHIGISPGSVLAIGDSNNDMQVLSLAGYVGCPSNSKNEVIDLVRKKGGYVAKTAYTDGVIEILRHYRLIE